MAVTVSVCVSFVAPEVMPERLTDCKPAPSLIVTLARALSVGDWLTALTVTVKERVTMLLLAPPSVTATVSVAEPNARATGVKAIVPVLFGLV